MYRSTPTERTRCLAMATVSLSGVLPQDIPARVDLAGVPVRPLGGHVMRGADDAGGVADVDNDLSASALFAGTTAAVTPCRSAPVP